MAGLTRVFLLGDNQICADAAHILRSHGADIVGLGLHAPERRRAEAAIREAVPGVPVFDPGAVRNADERIFALEPALAVSVFYVHILKAAFFERLPTVNLHPALLPWNRGAYPNVWSIIDGTPAGVTLHEVDAGVDTGRVLAQRPVDSYAWDTGKTLYERLLRAALALLDETADDLLAGRLESRPQQGEGSSHRFRDVDAVDRLDLDATMRVGDLIDRLRARTFPPHRGCWFAADGRRVHVRIDLEPEEP